MSNKEVDKTCLNLNKTQPAVNIYCSIMIKCGLLQYFGSY